MPKKYLFIDESGDHPEIRAKFFELLRELDGFKAHIVIAKKDINIFHHKHNSNPTEFYFDALQHLLNGKLIDLDCSYSLYLSQRGNNTLQRFQNSVEKALAGKDCGDTGKITYNQEIVPSNEMPELSVIDYLMWAVQRKLLTGESRYFDALQNKYASIINLYED